MKDAVRKGTLAITVTERGNLESAANVTLTSRVEGTTVIIRIVEEGTAVKKGDLLVELDSSKHRNDATQQQIALKQAESAERQASENLAIQKTQNDSDIAAAQLKLDLAILDLEKYKKGEYVQQRSAIEGEITLASETLTRAMEKYEFTKRLAKKGYSTISELEADRIAVTKAEIDAGVAKEKLRVLGEYDSKRQLAEKESNAREFERELERVRRKAQAAIVQAEADHGARKLTADVERTKYERLLAQIEACKLFAPQDGLVVYANERGSRMSGSQDVTISEGAQVRERQAIINLPDVTRMRVSARIHESKIDMVHEGLAANIRVDARPGEVFHGHVSTVSLVPLSGSWPNYNLKEYATNISIADSVEKVSSLKPGLTAEVEILVAKLENVLMIPLESVIERGGRHFVFVLTAESVARREVKVGRHNDVHMEIKEGLSEGQEVVVNPRTGLASEISLLESEIPVAAEVKKPEDAHLPAKDKGESTGDGARPKSKRGGSGAGAPPGGGPTGGGPGGGGDPLAFFKRFDADNDGKLSLAEAPEFLKSRFSQLDTNSDMYVDLAEFQTGSAAMRRGPGGPGAGAPGAGAPGAGGGQ